MIATDRAAEPGQTKDRVRRFALVPAIEGVVRGAADLGGGLITRRHGERKAPLDVMDVADVMVICTCWRRSNQHSCCDTACRQPSGREHRTSYVAAPASARWIQAGASVGRAENQSSRSRDPERAYLDRAGRSLPAQDADLVRGILG